MKGCNWETARWKRCLGKVGKKGLCIPALSRRALLPESPGIRNPEALQIPSFWVIMGALLNRHDWLVKSSATGNWFDLQSFSSPLEVCVWELGEGRRGTKIPALWSHSRIPWQSPDPLLRSPNEKVLVTQLCPTLSDPRNCSPPGSSVHGILQARILEWVAIPFSTGPSWPRDQTRVSCIAGGFFTVWATTEAQALSKSHLLTQQTHLDDSHHWGNSKV